MARNFELALVPARRASEAATGTRDEGKVRIGYGSQSLPRVPGTYGIIAKQSKGDCSEEDLPRPGDCRPGPAHITSNC